MNEFLHKVYFGNPLSAYLLVAAGIIAGILLLRRIKHIVFTRLKRRLQKKSTYTTRLITAVLEHALLPLLYLVIIYSATTALTTTPKVATVTGQIMMVLFTFFTIRIIIAIIRAIVTAYLHKRGEESNKVSEISGLLIIVNLIIWSIGVIFLLDNLGYNITTIIAGLGIGGIAIALAAQAVLGDFFSYFVILFDKPFEAGDFIQVDDFLGTIEHIGIKTTRIQNLAGEQLIFSNTDLTGSRLHNYKRMKQRRISFDFGIVKSTPQMQLNLIPEMVKTIIEKTPNAAYNRGHFTAIEDSSFRFGFVYYVLSADYTVYLDVQQSINLGILEGLESRGIALAYPTQTLLVQAKENISFN